MLKNGAFLGITGNLPGTNTAHHLTITGDPSGGLMRVHDTFQVGSQSLGISGDHYNDLASLGGGFNPSPAALSAFREMFK